MAECDGVLTPYNVQSEILFIKNLKIVNYCNSFFLIISNKKIIFDLESLELKLK